MQMVFTTEAHEFLDAAEPNDFDKIQLEEVCEERESYPVTHRTGNQEVSKCTSLCQSQVKNKQYQHQIYRNSEQISQLEPFQ